MDVNAIVWIFITAVTVLIGVDGLWEFNRERVLHCERCGRTEPFPEREMMKLRYGQAAHCPDCGTQLTRRRANRSA